MCAFSLAQAITMTHTKQAEAEEVARKQQETRTTRKKKTN